MPKAFFSIEEVQEILGLSRSTIYARVKEGDLRITHIGRRALIPGPSIRKFVKHVQAEASRSARA